MEVRFKFTKLLNNHNMNLEQEKTNLEGSKNQVPTIEAIDNLKQFKNEEENNYLQKRGIQDSIYNKYDNFKVNQTSALFPLYSNIRSGKSELCSTVLYKFNSQGEESKYFQKGLPRGIVIFKEKGIDSFKRITFTESPIDALSHHQIKNSGPNTQDTLYVCSCGSLSREIRKDIDYIMEYAKKKNIRTTLAFGNDPTGKELHSELVSISKDKALYYSIDTPPMGESWNEKLWQEAKQANKQEREASNNRKKDRGIKI